MSEQHAMGVCLTDELVEGCDAHESDVCLAFSETLVRMAGGVIAGAKPAAIFNLSMRVYTAGRWRRLVRHVLDEALRTYAGALPGYGVSLSVLYRTDKRVYLLVWRPDLLEQALADAEGLAILRECGYVGTTPDQLVCELRRRLVAYYLSLSSGTVAFPHEIGVFLGYPPEDVRGFLAGKTATCRGAWQAFGDEQAARRRFRALEAHERRCRMRFASGEPLKALFATQGCA